MSGKKAILEVKIEFDRQGLRIETERGEVSMIPFAGKVDSEIFKGIVEPWGVDTQILDHADMRHMSARYMLTGKDLSGEDCHIYVDNDGWMKNELSRTFRTVPKKSRTFMPRQEKVSTRFSHSALSVRILS